MEPEVVGDDGADQRGGQRQQPAHFAGAGQRTGRQQQRYCRQRQPHLLGEHPDEQHGVTVADQELERIVHEENFKFKIPDSKPKRDPSLRSG